MALDIRGDSGSDLSNLDGFVRQWVFGPGDSLAPRIAQDLKA